MTVQPWGAADCDFAWGTHPAGVVSNPARALRPGMRGLNVEAGRQRMFRACLNRRARRAPRHGAPPCCHLE